MPCVRVMWTMYGAAPRLTEWLTDSDGFLLGGACARHGVK